MIFETLPPILFATQSRYKIGLFKRIGLSFETASPEIEENHPEFTDPGELAMDLAELKANALAEKYPEHLIIGADQVLALGTQLLTKPGTTEATVAQLQRLAGKTHTLHTAYHLLQPRSGYSQGRLVLSHIRFHANLSESFLRDLVESEKSQDCVGGYKIESKGLLLVESMETPDFNAIIGLPLLSLIDDLSKCGYMRERFATEK